jgi:hypothetical protein
LVAAASRANSALVSITCPGTITTLTTWSGGGIVTSLFKHTDATNYGWVQGASPLMGPSFPVSSADIQAGATWMFYVTSSDSQDHSVSYTITRN